MSFFTSAIDVLQTLVIALGGGLCVSGAASTFWKVTARTTLAPMLMCHKVTHKKLIDNSPLFRKNFKVEFHGSHTNCVASFA